VNRIQIYLDADQTARLDERAAAEGTTRSSVIRRAVDVYLAQEEPDRAAWREQWKRELDSSAGIASYLKEGVEYVDEIRRTDPERLS
jgi:metal-responsive CopG/Arc/MetJ family transcriptional regulator